MRKLFAKFLTELFNRDATNIQNYWQTLKTRIFSDGAGAVAGTGVTVVEKGVDDVVHKTVITFTNTVVTVANETGASFGSQKIYDFPQGRIHILGGRANLTFNWAGTDIAATGSGDFSLGTTATADATLSSTDVDLMASTAMLDPFVAGVGTGKGNLVKTTEFDGTTTAIDAFLNLIIDDADVDDGDSDPVTINGTITILWINEGL